MDDKHRELLVRNRCDIVRDLEVEKICDRLIEKEIINCEDFEQIKSRNTREERVRELLDMIPRRGENAFRAFKDALAEYPSYKKLVNILDDDERDMRSPASSSRTEKCSTLENHYEGVTERGIGPQSAAEPCGTTCQTQHHISINHTGTKYTLLSSNANSINGDNASSGPKAISYIHIGSFGAQDSSNGSLLTKPQLHQILPLVDQNQTCLMTSHTGTTDTPLISDPAEENIISSGPKAMSYIPVDDSYGGSYANGCFLTKLQLHQTLPLEGSQDSPLDLSCKSNEQENENGSPQSKQCQTVADISPEIGYIGLGKNGSRETAIKFSTHLERWTEEGKFQQFDEFVGAFLISKHSRDPDIKIPVLAECVVGEYFRDSSDGAIARARDMHSAIRFSENHTEHEVHYLFLQAAVERKNKHPDEARTCVEGARQIMVKLPPGKITGEVHYNIAAILSDHVSKMVSPPPKQLMDEIIWSYEMAIEAYKADSHGVCVNLARRSHVRLAMALLGTWNHAKTPSRFRPVPPEYIERAKVSLQASFSDYSGKIPKRGLFYYNLAQSDLAYREQDFQKAFQLAEMAKSIADEHFPAEVTYANSRLKLLEPFCTCENCDIDTDHKALMKLVEHQVEQ